MTKQTQKDNLVFEETKDPEVIRFTHMQNGENWAPPFMSKEDYLQRERVIGTSEISTKHLCPKMQKRFPEGSECLGIKYYVLRNLGLPATSKTSQVVASCETLNRVGMAASPQTGGAVQPVLTACIGGVYTLPEYRCKGYGSQMITRLNKLYDEYSQRADTPPLAKTVVMTLYSEVGEYYSKFGFSSRPVPVHVVKNIDRLLNEYCGGEPGGGDGGGRALDFDGCESLLERQVREFSQNITRLQKENPNAFVFAVEPSLDNFRLFHRRGLFHKKYVEPDSPVTFGYALPNGSHLVWHHNYYPGDRALFLLKLHVSEDSEDKDADLKLLLAQAICEAKKTKIDRLQFWDTELGHQAWSKPFMEFLGKIEDKSGLYQENPSRSAVRVSGFKGEDIIWDHNTKYCWF